MAAESHASRVGPHAPKGATPTHTRPAPQPPGQVGAIQRIIVKGTTPRSKKLGLKQSDWYKKELNDAQKAFAEQLHRDEENYYTRWQALDIINERIKNGEPPPTFTVSVKDERKQRVRQYVNTNAPKESDEAYKMGEVLKVAGKRAYRRHSVKYIRLKEKRFDEAVEKINTTKPGLFDDQEKILKNFSEWERVFSLTHSDPQSYDLDLGGEKVTLDSKDVVKHEERRKKRKREDPAEQRKKRKLNDYRPTINLAQVFIEQENKDNSYWAISDSTDTSIWRPSAFKMLRHLEVERENESVFTTYLKDTLFQSGKLTNKEAFGDENLLTFQEYKGALSPWKNMAKIQTASAYRVLMLALKNKDAKLGRKVKNHPLTSAGALFDALDAYMKSKTDPNYKKLVKEIYRLIRVQTREDMSSDTEDDEL